MRANTAYIFILCLLSVTAMAQAPQGINYQGVARGMDGQALSQKEISIRIAILNQSADGNIEYAEIHELKTNQFGLFTLMIGKGTPGTGTFTSIDWSSGNKWVQIELDENGGRNFQLMGSQQLMSVPYALYAEKSGSVYQAGQGIGINNNMISNLGDGDNNSNNELITSVSFGTDNKLRITDAGGTKEADLNSLVGAAQDLENVLTQGNGAGNNSITNLGTPVNASDAATKAYVDAHVDGDANATNELQTISTQSVDANTRSLSLSDGNTINVDVKDADANATNEVQSIARSGNNITLTQVSGTGGGTVSIDDADANPTNEAQTLNKTGTTVTLTNVSGTGGGSFVLNDDSNTNEAQTISRTGSNVTLTQANGAGGGSFSIDDADANATNELQNLSQVLSRGTDANGSSITNMANPTDPQDATTKNYVDAADAMLLSKISTTYAFKATFDYQNLSGLVVNNQNMPFTDDFDDFNTIGATTFTAAENGIYMFSIEGAYNTLIAGGSLSLLYNAVKYPITIVMPFGATQPRFSGTFTFKLTTGQTVSLVGDNIALLAHFNGVFFGYKL